MKKVPNPRDGQPTPDMPEVDNHGTRRGHYASLVSEDPKVYEFDTEAGIGPEEAVARPLRRGAPTSAAESRSRAAVTPSSGATTAPSRSHIPYVIDNQTHRMADVLNS